MPDQQPRQTRNDQEIEDRVQSSQPNPSFDALVAAFDLAAQRKCRAFNVFGMLDRPVTGVFWDLASGQTLTKLGSKVAHDHGDPSTDRGCFNLQHRSSAGERTGAAQGKNDSEVIPIHGLHFCSP